MGSLLSRLQCLVNMLRISLWWPEKHVLNLTGWNIGFTFCLYNKLVRGFRKALLKAFRKKDLLYPLSRRRCLRRLACWIKFVVRVQFLRRRRYWAYGMLSIRLTGWALPACSYVFPAVSFLYNDEVSRPFASFKMVRSKKVIWFCALVNVNFKL